MPVAPPSHRRWLRVPGASAATGAWPGDGACGEVPLQAFFRLTDVEDRQSLNKELHKAPRTAACETPPRHSFASLGATRVLCIELTQGTGHIVGGPSQNRPGPTRRVAPVARPAALGVHTPEIPLKDGEPALQPRFADAASARTAFVDGDGFAAGLAPAFDSETLEGAASSSTVGRSGRTAFAMTAPTHLAVAPTIGGAIAEVPQPPLHTVAAVRSSLSKRPPPAPRLAPSRQEPRLIGRGTALMPPAPPPHAPPTPSSGKEYPRAIPSTRPPAALTLDAAAGGPSSESESETSSARRGSSTAKPSSPSRACTLRGSPARVSDLVQEARRELLESADVSTSTLLDQAVQRTASFGDRGGHSGALPSGVAAVAGDPASTPLPSVPMPSASLASPRPPSPPRTAAAVSSSRLVAPPLSAPPSPPLPFMVSLHVPPLPVSSMPVRAPAAAISIRPSGLVSRSPLQPQVATTTFAGSLQGRALVERSLRGLFQKTGRAALDAMLDAFYELSLPAGKVIFQQGDSVASGPALCVLGEGVVDVMLQSRATKQPERVCTYDRAGQTFGELESIFRPVDPTRHAAPRVQWATFETRTPVKIWVADRRPLLLALSGDTWACAATHAEL